MCGWRLVPSDEGGGLPPWDGWFARHGLCDNVALAVWKEDLRWGEPCYPLFLGSGLSKGCPLVDGSAAVVLQWCDLGLPSWGTDTGEPDFTGSGWPFLDALFGRYDGVVEPFVFTIVADLICREVDWGTSQSVGGACNGVVVVSAGGGNGVLLGLTRWSALTVGGNIVADGDSDVG